MLLQNLDANGVSMNYLGLAGERPGGGFPLSKRILSGDRLSRVGGVSGLVVIRLISDRSSSSSRSISVTDLPLTTINSISRGTVNLGPLPVVNFFPPSISNRVASVMKSAFISSVSDRCAGWAIQLSLEWQFDS